MIVARSFLVSGSVAQVVNLGPFPAGSFVKRVVVWPDVLVNAEWCFALGLSVAPVEAAADFAGAVTLITGAPVNGGGAQYLSPVPLVRLPKVASSNSSPVDVPVNRRVAFDAYLVFFAGNPQAGVATQQGAVFVDVEPPK